MEKKEKKGVKEKKDEGKEKDSVSTESDQKKIILTQPERPAYIASPLQDVTFSIHGGDSVAEAALMHSRAAEMGECPEALALYNTAQAMLDRIYSMNPPPQHPRSPPVSPILIPRKLPSTLASPGVKTPILLLL